MNAFLPLSFFINRVFYVLKKTRTLEAWSKANFECLGDDLQKRDHGKLDVCIKKDLN